MQRIESYLLNLAGEYRVCSELNRRGVFATITCGNRKSVDVYAISDRQERALKIEVKTTQRMNFVTGITQKGLEKEPTAPDFWVLFQLRPNRDGTFADRFFVLSHAEICKIQKKRNAVYAKSYKARHGHGPNLSAGVDNVRLADVERHEQQWSKIIVRVRRRGKP